MSGKNMNHYSSDKEKTVGITQPTVFFGPGAGFLLVSLLKTPFLLTRRTRVSLWNNEAAFDWTLCNRIGNLRFTPHPCHP